MTAEPLRQPDDETEEPPRPEGEAPRPEEPPRSEGDANPESTHEPDAPSASESLTETATESVTAPAENLTPEAAASAEAAAAAEADPNALDPNAAADPNALDPNMDPNASEAAVAAADAQEMATTAQAVATVDAATDAGAATPATATPATEKGSRRRAAGRALRQLVVIVLGLTLLVAGIALGNYAFQVTRPAPTGGVGDPGIGSQEPPAAAQEFIAALAVNDADAIRSSLDRDPHMDLTREMTKYGIQRVDEVEVLGTTVDGPRSATEILMHYEREDGISFAINLVILVDGGKIEGFR